MTEFMVEAEGPDELFAVFHEDQGSGFFFVYRQETNSVLEQVRVHGGNVGVREDDVEVLWSADQSKCGVTIFGEMRGIIDLKHGQQYCAPLEERHSPEITDTDWLSGFDTYFNRTQFIRSRQKFWKDTLKRYQANAEPLREEDTPIETNFILHAKGPDGLFAVFEDEGRSGYLYVYNSEQRRVSEYVHLYDRSENVQVAREDVSVFWSEDGRKCGIMIWDQMRGIIDRSKDLPGRVWIESRDTPGIDDPEWLEGFTLR